MIKKMINREGYHLQANNIKDQPAHALRETQKFQRVLDGRLILIVSILAQ